MKTDWSPALTGERSKPYFIELQQFVALERRRFTVYPPESQVYAALHATSHEKTKVLLLGQDPYHGEGQAHGLCFSVPRGIAIPPSLRNIYKELSDDVGVPIPNHGCLESWAAQGVLMLNATLTVRAGHAGSHQGRGWETFTDHVIRVVNDKVEPVVFVLWGAYARKKRALVTNPHHTIVESPHPSPLSAHTGFFGSRPFSQINDALSASGHDAIDWSLT